MTDRYYRDCPFCGKELSFLGLDAISTCECGRVFSIRSIIEQIIPDPIITKDGNHWCAAYRDRSHDAVIGMGSSPDEALEAFNLEWEARYK